MKLRRNVQMITFCMVTALLSFVSACNRQDVIPERLEGRIDRDLRFAQVKENPDAYRGKLMLAGGKVLSAKQLKEGTRIEVLQIPLSSDLVPVEEQQESRGRFVALDRVQQIADPAVLDEDTLVTVVGEVIGSTTIKIDEVERQVPTLAIKHVTIWDRDQMRPYSGYRTPYA